MAHNVKHPTDLDFMNSVEKDSGALEADYRKVIEIINSLEVQVKRVAVDKNISRLGDVLEGIYLLRKVMGIEGVK